MKEVSPGVKIDPTNVILSTHSGEILCVCGDISVTYNAYANADTYLCAIDWGRAFSLEEMYHVQCYTH